MKTLDANFLSFAKAMTPAEMNKIHFCGNHTPLTPEKIAELAKAAANQAREENNSVHAQPGAEKM